MPFCNQCGTPVQPVDRFCAKCGASQPNATGSASSSTSSTTASSSTVPPGTPVDILAGVNSRTIRLLCYVPVVGWICAIVVLASARFRQEPETRFHAFQGLYLFVAWLLLDMVVSPMFNLEMPGFGFTFIPKLLKLGVMAAWVFMIIKTAHGENYRLPILGELADRSVSEQR